MATNIDNLELRQIINYLFEGRGGQSELARLVRCNDSTIRRYLSGSREIPEYLGVILAHLHERKRSGLDINLDIDRGISELLFLAKQRTKIDSPLSLVKSGHTKVAN